MIERIEDLPEPVVGVRAEGKVERSDYEQTVIPAVRAVLETHERVRLLYVLGDDFDGYSIGAMWEDTKLGAGHLRSWERIAVVTDADWVENAVKAFGWMIPGEVRVFDDDDEAEARTWIAEGLSRRSGGGGTPPEAGGPRPRIRHRC